MTAGKGFVQLSSLQTFYQPNLALPFEGLVLLGKGNSEFRMGVAQKRAELFKGVFPLGKNKIFFCTVVLVVAHAYIDTADVAAQNLQIAATFLLVVPNTQAVSHIVFET